MKTIKLSKKLEVPLGIVTQKVNILGTTGSGKSYLQFKLTELFLDNHVQVVFLDPKGEAWGLRLMADGKTPAYPIPVFGGPHGDLPLRPDMGKQVAEVLVNGNYSAILDVSEFISSELSLFGYEFATRLFQLKKSNPGAMSLMIDEAQEFCPQNPQEKGLEVKMLGAFERLGKQGRSKGIGMVIASQQPQSVNKKLLNMAELWFNFRMTGLQERETMQKLFRDKDRAESDKLFEILPKLETGHAHLWSPNFLRVSGEYEILPKKTFDSSKTPEVGDSQVVARKLSPVDIESLSASIENVIQEEKANDPKALRRRIAELESELRRRDSQAAGPAVEQVEIPMLQPEEIDTLTRYLDSSYHNVSELIEFHKQFIPTLESVKESLDRASNQKNHTFHLPIKANGHKQPLPTSVSDAAHAGRGVVVYDDKGPSSGTELTAPQQRILAALDWLQQHGIRQPRRTLVALLSKQGKKSSGYVNNNSFLRSRGLISYPNGQTLEITSKGIRVSELEHIPLTDYRLSDGIPGFLPGKQSAMLSCLLSAYPDSVSREELAKKSGQSFTSSGFVNNLSALCGMGLANYPSASEARLSDEFGIMKNER